MEQNLNINNTSTKVAERASLEISKRSYARFNHARILHMQILAEEAAEREREQKRKQMQEEGIFEEEIEKEVAKIKAKKFAFEVHAQTVDLNKVISYAENPEACVKAMADGDLDAAEADTYLAYLRGEVVFKK